ncbi:MAG TPA: hypothetical protein VFZ78_11840, partial [Flavisolibacter sp.]
TTRLRALSGEQLVCSNTDLTNSRVHNFKRMTERRVQFSLGVVYQTPAPTLEQIPAMIRTVIEDLPDTRFDRAHFKTFGASSLDFEAVYFVLSPEYNTFMDVQQRVNLELFRRFEQSGIQFAYPTQMVYVVPTQEEKQARE